MTIGDIIASAKPRYWAALIVTVVLSAIILLS